jgi:hypothetical protein
MDGSKVQGEDELTHPMRAPITVITATIPGREERLSQTVKSVYAQTIEVESQLIMAQSCSEGFPGPAHCAMQQNALLAAVTTTWVMRLADDDLLLRHHISTLLPFLTDEFDVVYSWDATGNRPREDCTNWSREELIAQFAVRNWIDASAVAFRMNLLRRVGGWPTNYEGTPPFQGHFLGIEATCEDHGGFYLLARAGARFRCVPEETWQYQAGAWDRISNGNVR